MYALTFYSHFQERLAARDDPFRTGSVLAILIFIIVVQKYIFEAMLSSLIEDKVLFTQKLLVTFR